MPASCRPALLWTMAALAASALSGIGAAQAGTILFVGNSFTFGAGSAVRIYRPGSVQDLNHRGSGGVPALFKMFATEAGQHWDVSLEAVSGQDLAFHLASRRAELEGRWDVVVLQDYSTLDRLHPGDAAAHLRDAARLASLFKAANPRVRVMLETTWPRADLTYPAGAFLHGRPIGTLIDEIARANAAAMANGGALFAGILPVGEAWLRAMDRGVADPDPYDGIAPGKIDLWTWDHYHASSAGYYLAALVIFGRISGVDPRSLGARERAADELGIGPATAVVLQRVAAEELAAASPTRPD